MSWIGVLKVFQATSLHRIFTCSTDNLVKMPFYAVAKGRAPGVFMSWGDCEAQVKGFSGARYKKFDSMAAAADFIAAESSTASAKSAPKPSSNNSNYLNSNTSNYNLKRSYSTSSNHQKKSSGPSSTYKPAPVSNDDSESEMSDDLDAILNKQMDDIENRLKGFEKGLNNIIKKSAPKSSQRKIQLIEPPQPKRRRSANKEFDTDNYGFVQVYTDGACSANGRSGARAGLGVYWGDGHTLNVSAPVSGRATNNCGEIQAATKAIKQALDNGITRLSINTDSKFLINAVTKWIPGWKKKGWKLASGEPVKNEIDFKDLDSVKDKLTVKWNYVEAHRGIHGNEEADRLAKAGAEQFRNK